MLTHTYIHIHTHSAADWQFETLQTKIRAAIMGEDVDYARSRTHTNTHTHTHTHIHSAAERQFETFQTKIRAAMMGDDVDYLRVLEEDARLDTEITKLRYAFSPCMHVSFLRIHICFYTCVQFYLFMQVSLCVPLAGLHLNVCVACVHVAHLNASYRTSECAI